MDKSIITVKCNTQFWFVCLTSFLLWFALFFALYTSKSNDGVIFFANYANSFILSANPNETKNSTLPFPANSIIPQDSSANPNKTKNSSLPFPANSIIPQDPSANLNKTNSTPADRNKTRVDSCSGRYIYVHDLPRKFNLDILKNCSSLNKWFDMCKPLSNMGFGPRVVMNSDGIHQNQSWFATNQFLLEIIFDNRMKRYECLTNDSSFASAIYVPYYAGLDIGRYLWDYNTSVRDSNPLDLVRWLARQPEWKYLSGRDHFFVGGRITWDFTRQTDDDSDWGNKLRLLPEAKNMTFLIIESSTETGNNNGDNAVPYPTYFHPSSDGEVLQWQDKVRRERRRYLFSFIGGARPMLRDSIRGEIISQCRASSKKCKLLDCWDNAGLCEDPIHVMEIFQSSVFCLQPPGDSYTRRSTFDSILAGCIPVFFHPASAYTQYLWHLPKHYTKYSVFIPGKDIKDSAVNIEQILNGIPKEEVAAMREEVIGLIPKIIYANPMSRLETIEDAFDIAIKGVLDRVENIRREMKAN